MRTTSPFIQAIVGIVRLATGRVIEVRSNTSPLMLVGYATRQALDLLRGLIVQACALRSPRPLALARGARIRGIREMAFGDWLRLGPGSELVCWTDRGIVLGANVSLGEYCTILNAFNAFAKAGVVRFGDNVGIGGYSYICCSSLVEIGSNTIVGQYFSIHPENHLFGDRDCLIRLQGVSALGVVVGENTWIGAKVTILDGVTLGEGCVVAAGAVVNKSFGAGSIIGGVPARLLGSRY